MTDAVRRIRRRAWLLPVLLVVAVAAIALGCAQRDQRRSDDGDDALRPPSSRAGDENATTTTGLRTTSTTDSTQPEPTTTGTTPPTHDDDNGDANDVNDVVTDVASISELMRRADELVDRDIQVRGKAFFLEECPPPDQADGGPCSLLLFIGDADRDGLIYGERDQAIPGFADGVRVMCEVGPTTTTACAGWTAGAVYDLTGTIRPQQFGPRVDLHISNRSPA